MRIILPPLTVAMLVLLLPWQAVAANAERDVLIKELFPKATVIGDKKEDFPVWPVYQLNKLIGYTFEFNDHIDRQQVETALGSSLADYPEEDIVLTGADDNIKLYYAYLNAPSVGANLLGEAEQQRMLSRLKPGEHALAVMSEGFYSYIGQEFRPGTVPDRISLVQNGLPITIRDMNFYDSSAKNLAAGVPAIDNMRLFRIRPKTGFDPSAAMELQLIVELAKNQNPQKT